jgi:hypothetical protein
MKDEEKTKLKELIEKIKSFGENKIPIDILREFAEFSYSKELNVSTNKAAINRTPSSRALETTFKKSHYQ